MPKRRRGAMAILAFFFSATRFVSGAMAAHLPGLLQGCGATEVAAIAAGALVGPAQVGGAAARVRAAALVSSAAVGAHRRAAAPARRRVAGRARPGRGAVFAVLHGAGNGMITIAKGTLPLAIFGPAGYGRRNGILSVPTRIAEASAPLLFGLLLTAIGIKAVLVTAGLCLSAFASLLLLRARPAPDRALPSAGN